MSNTNNMLTKIQCTKRKNIKQNKTNVITIINYKHNFPKIVVIINVEDVFTSYF